MADATPPIPAWTALPVPADLLLRPGVWRPGARRPDEPDPGAHSPHEVVVTADDAFHRERTRLVRELRELGIRSSAEDENTAADTGDASRVDLRRSGEDLGAEGFRLEVTPAGALVEASTPTGIFRGTRQLVQNLRAQGAVPAASVRSRPAVGERGLHIDAARKFFPVSWWEATIRDAADIGVTSIQWHFSENEGFRLESRRHPEIVSPDHITLAEAERLIALAADLHIEIIPSLDMPGHLRHALAAHPELRLPAPGNGLDHDHALDITNPRARDFARDLIDEYAEVFSTAAHWNLGGDEFVDFDRIDDHPALASAARNAYGPSGTGFDLLTAFINEMAAHVAARGFIPRVWNDGMLRSANVALDPRIEFTWWTNWNAGMRPVREAFAQGFRVVNVNDAMFYYVLGENAGYRYPTAARLWEADWHPGVFPQLHPSIPDREQIVAAPYPASLLGTSFAIWCDRPDAQSPAEVAAGIRSPLRAFAERSWNGGSRLDLAAFSAVDAALPAASEAAASAEPAADAASDAAEPAADAASTTSETAQPAELTVMTYNIRNGHPDPGHEWAERAPLVAEVIRRSRPDLIGLQEVLAPQLADLVAALPEHDHAGIGRDGASADEHGPVFWRRDRFDAVAAGQFWLSDTPESAGSNTWGSLCTRCATWVRLRPRDSGGGEIVFATTHLDHEETAHGDEVRLRSARLLGERFGRLDVPAILTGDFNTTPAADAHAVLAAAGLRQHPSATAPDAAPSFHDYGRAARPERIDWILHTAGLQTRELRVDAADPASAASDHHPVLARIAATPAPRN